MSRAAKWYLSTCNCAKYVYNGILAHVFDLINLMAKFTIIIIINVLGPKTHSTCALDYSGKKVKCKSHRCMHLVAIKWSGRAWSQTRQIGKANVGCGQLPLYKQGQRVQEEVWQMGNPSESYLGYYSTTLGWWRKKGRTPFSSYVTLWEDRTLHHVAILPSSLAFSWTKFVLSKERRRDYYK